MHSLRKRYRVCILQCRDESLFTALTSAAPARCVAAHNTDDAADSYTKGRRPVRLIHSMDLGTDRCSAMGVVFTIRHLNKRNKLRLMAGDAMVVAHVFTAGQEMGKVLRERFRRANRNASAEYRAAQIVVGKYERTAE